MILQADKEGIITLDDKELQGVLQSLSINGEIVIDSTNSTSNNKPQKIMRGYKDKVISITLRIVETEEKTVYEILEEIEHIFQDKEDSTPKIFTLFNEHTFSRGIDKVLFTSLSSSEDNTTDTVTVSLTFEEFVEARYQ